MLTKVRTPLLILVALTTLVCTVIAIRRDEFNTLRYSQSNSPVFVPVKFQAKNNDTVAIAQEAQSGNFGSVVVVEHATSTRPAHPNIFYKTYLFFAFLGYLLLSGLIIFYWRF
jgi:hypothetical protein